MPLIQRFLLLCAAFGFAPALLAQPAFFGDPLPLASTRYGTAEGLDGKLVTNGHDFFLFWRRDDIYLTRLTDGEPRVGTPLVRGDGYDVLWTGNGFLVAFAENHAIHTQMFDAEGRPLGEPLSILSAGSPRLAFNGRRVLLLADADDSDQTLWMVLDANGVPAPGSGAFTDPWVGAAASDGEGFAAVFWKSVHGSTRELWVRLFDNHGQPIGEQMVMERHSGPALVAIAGSQAGYLIAQCGVQRRCDATLLDRAGHKRDPVVVYEMAAHQTAESVKAIWNGEGWTAASNMRTSTTIARLDPEARNVLSREVTAGYNVQSFAAIGTRLKAALARESYGPLSTADLPLEGKPVRAATHLPVNQWLLATEISSEATLFAWHEFMDDYRTLWIGVRRSSGGWIEREISREIDYDEWSSPPVVAGSDGNGFVVAFTEAGRPRTTYVDSYGWRRWTRTIPFMPHSMTWNGSVFGLIAMTWTKNADGAQLVSLRSTGHLSERVFIPLANGSWARIASDGYGFLAVMTTACTFESCPTEAVAIRLGPDLQRSDDVTIGLPENATTSWSLSVIWDGRDYLVTWGGEELVRIPRIARPSRLRDSHRIENPIPTRAGFAATVNGDNVGLFSRGGALLFTFPVPAALRGFRRDLLQLPDGRIAVLYLSAQNGAPGYGRARMVMAISDALPPVKPDAPSISVTATSAGDFIVGWTPPSHTVTGYRLEYRAGDAPWKELERWFAADARWTTFEPLDAGETYTFRMRAWSDAGVSAYSNEVRSSSSTARSSID